MNISLYKVSLLPVVEFYRAKSIHKYHKSKDGAAAGTGASARAGAVVGMGVATKKKIVRDKTHSNKK